VPHTGLKRRFFRQSTAEAQDDPGTWETAHTQPEYDHRLGVLAVENQLESNRSMNEEQRNDLWEELRLVRGWFITIQ